jgi:hypothetical protein
MRGLLGLPTLLGLSLGAFRFGLFSGWRSSDSFGELLASRFTIPLLESLIRDFSLDQKLRELASLSLALERHRPSRLTRGIVLTACNYHRVTAGFPYWHRDK